MFDALAGSKSVLINVSGWLGDMIQENNCGKCLNPHRPETLAEALEELASNPDLCQEMGTNARWLVERQFDRMKLAHRLEKVLFEAVEQYR